jgi:ubiquinone/menaquinone biosynthesis C-methylase UbiE
MNETRDPKQIVADGYNKVAVDYARLEGEEKWPRMRWLSVLQSKLEPGSSILDLGCGSGDPADIEVARDHQITGVDISKVQIDMARKNVPSGCFMEADAGTVKFPKASFDAVISFYSLEHIPRKEHINILKRIHHWLRPEGYLLFCVEATDYDDEIGIWLGVPMFISSFDPETIKQMVTKVEFDILETTIDTQVEQGNKIPYLWILARKRGDRSNSI